MECPNFLEGFRKMVAELEDHPDIQLLTCKINPPVAESELEEIQRKFDISSEVFDFYRQANGIEIKWEAQKVKEIADAELTVGCIDLLPVKEVFGDWINVIYFDDDDTFRLLHPVDFFVEEACAALYLNGSQNPEVYYHYCGEDLYPTGLNFQEYLCLLLEARGFWYWQKTLIKSSDLYESSKGDLSVEESNFFRVMPKLFPGFDGANFRKD